MNAPALRYAAMRHPLLRDRGKEAAAERVAHGAPAEGRPSTAPAPAELGLGPGQSLPAVERSYFERRLGADLSAVRVHPESSAAAALGARGFAAGRDIAVAPGQWRPGTAGFRRLIGHEIAHTIQQGHGGPALQLDGPGPPGTVAPAGTAGAQPPTTRPNPWTIERLVASTGYTAEQFGKAQRYFVEGQTPDLANLSPRDFARAGGLVLPGELFPQAPPKAGDSNAFVVTEDAAGTTIVHILSHTVIRIEAAKSDSYPETRFRRSYAWQIVAPSDGDPGEIRIVKSHRVRVDMEEPPPPSVTAGLAGIPVLNSDVTDQSAGASLYEEGRYNFVLIEVDADYVPTQGEPIHKEAFEQVPGASIRFSPDQHSWVGTITGGQFAGGMLLTLLSAMPIVGPMVTLSMAAGGYDVYGRPLSDTERRTMALVAVIGLLGSAAGSLAESLPGPAPVAPEGAGAGPGMAADVAGPAEGAAPAELGPQAAGLPDADTVSTPGETSAQSAPPAVGGPEAGSAPNSGNAGWFGRLGQKYVLLRALAEGVGRSEVTPTIGAGGDVPSIVLVDPEAAVPAPGAATAPDPGPATPAPAAATPAGDTPAAASAVAPTPAPSPVAATSAAPSAAPAASLGDYLQALQTEAHGPGSVGGSWDYQNHPVGLQESRWQTGLPINMPNSRGTRPSHDTERPRYWRNRAYFELQARQSGAARFQPGATNDPVAGLTDDQLRRMVQNGQAPGYAFANRPGQTWELEHTGVPQRVGVWLRALGFSVNEARGFTRESDPGSLIEVSPLEHAFFDYFARRFGRLRADVTGEQWATSPATDERVGRPLSEMSDADITTIVQQARARGLNFNRTAATRQLRDALRAEIAARGLNLAPP